MKYHGTKVIAYISANGFVPWPGSDLQQRAHLVACSYCGRVGERLTSCEGCGAQVVEATKKAS